MSKIVTLTTVSLLFSASTFAEEEDASLSTHLANPLAAMISVPRQINYDDDLGLNGDGSMWQINVQPVLPFQINENWNLITRTISPLIRQENLIRSNEIDSGLGDIMESMFFSPITALFGFLNCVAVANDAAVSDGFSAATDGALLMAEEAADA